MNLFRKKISNFVKKKILKIKTDEEKFLIDPNLSEEFKSLHFKCRDYTLTTIFNQYALYSSAKYIVENNIPGDIVECGVWKGGSALLMSLVFQNLNATDKKIFLYDTYTGMSKPTKYDYGNKTKINALPKYNEMKKNNYVDWCYASMEEVRSNMLKFNYPEKNLFFIKGKVEDTLKSHQHKKIALLRLDTDFYESTKVELEELFPLVSQNGIIIVDDYGHWAGAKKAVDDYISKNKLNVFLNRVDYTSRLIIKV